MTPFRPVTIDPRAWLIYRFAADHHAAREESGYIDGHRFGFFSDVMEVWLQLRGYAADAIEAEDMTGDLMAYQQNCAGLPHL